MLPKYQLITQQLVTVRAAVLLLRRLRRLRRLRLPVKWHITESTSMW
jgi:hypothetical protein